MTAKEFCVVFSGIGNGRRYGASAVVENIKKAGYNAEAIDVLKLPGVNQRIVDIYRGLYETLSRFPRV